ncbi:hypothetical protein [Burkholderia latens]|uniref:hypothetical protein n=1 Tax=Burkholderia latens TaxID=488446 RepID=UPI0014794A99|nr:hypothetical protein [Burkholderia latens]
MEVIATFNWSIESGFAIVNTARVRNRTVASSAPRRITGSVRGPAAGTNGIGRAAR